MSSDTNQIQLIEGQTDKLRVSSLLCQPIATSSRTYCANLYVKCNGSMPPSGCDTFTSGDAKMASLFSWSSILYMFTLLGLYRCRQPEAFYVADPHVYCFPLYRRPQYTHTQGLRRSTPIPFDVAGDRGGNYLTYSVDWAVEASRVMLCFKPSLWASYMSSRIFRSD